MYFRNVTLAALSLVFATVVPAQVVQLDSGLQENYAANLFRGESYIDIINTGANGAPALGPSIITGLDAAVGNMCVNVYALDPNEELVSCCSCLVTPDQTIHLGVNSDLTSNTATGVTPSAVTVVLAASLAGTGGSGTSCTYSAALITSVTNGMAAWGTTIQMLGSVPVLTRTAFVPVSGGSGSNLASLAGRCASIIGNNSGAGICTSCAIVREIKIVEPDGL
jgi:hypothetical protein